MVRTSAEAVSRISGDAAGVPRGGITPPLPARGHSKDHRPDLKQLVLDPDRVGRRGGADHPPPGKAAGLLSIAGRAGFLYVADCKLATCDNMDHIASRGGRFLTVLPRTRREDGPRGPGDALGFCL